MNYLRVSSRPLRHAAPVRVQRRHPALRVLPVPAAGSAALILLLTAVPARQAAGPRMTRSSRPRFYRRRPGHLAGALLRLGAGRPALRGHRPPPAQRVHQAERGLSAVRVPRPVHRAIARMTGVKFFTHLFGDSSYIVSYLRWLGYDLCAGRADRVELRHRRWRTRTPYMSIIGSGTMVADGLSIMNSDFSATSFRVSPVYDRGGQLLREQHRLPGGRPGGRQLPDRDQGDDPARRQGPRRGGAARLAAASRSRGRSSATRRSRSGRGRAAAAAAREELAQPADHRHLPVRAVAARLPGHRLRAGRLRLVRRVRPAGDGAPARGELPDHARLLRARGAR